MNIYGALIAAALAFGAGWQVNEWRHDAAKLEAERADNRAAIGRIDREAEKGASFEKERVRIQKQLVPVVQEVERIVTRVEYRDICLDDDGMRAVRAAIRGTEMSASEPVPAVPGSGGASGRDSGDHPAVDRLRGGGVPDLPSKAP